MKNNLFKTILNFAGILSATAAMAQCPTITCPSDITVNNDPGACGAVVTYATPTATNPCGMGTQTFSYTGSMQTFTVPAGVTSIHIEARGAQGGWNTNSVYQPGMGAVMSGDFTVTPSQQLQLLVGQQPSNGSGNGGGGGSFVVDLSNNPLIVAGGGGGSSQGTDSPNKHGQITTSGAAGSAGGGAGGTGGNGGSIGSSGFQSGAGGGFYTNGTDGWTSGTGGGSFISGGAGAATNAPANGGYGGGGSGSSYVVGGGGGGYSGGGSGGNSSAGVGGGGGSFNIGSNQVNTAGANTGNGSIIISYGSAPTVTRTAGLASGSLFPLGTSTVTHQADDGFGNIVTCSFTVTVNDNTAPVADNASINITSECATSVSAPTATDNCGTITGTTSDPTSYSSEGTYTINWTYNDGNGNTSTQSQTVVIDDVTSPVPDSSALATITGECSVTVSGAPTATDNCIGTITGTTTDPLTYSTLGTHIITWMYDDGHGNVSTQTQTVDVQDNTAPVADMATLPAINGVCSVTATAPTATDNCSGTITASTVDPTTYSVPGSYTINWTYSDMSGNVSLQTQTVTVSAVNTNVTQSGLTLTASASGASYAWLDCGTNTTIAGETSQSFTVTANGNYAAIVTEGGCTDTSACISIINVGLSENSSSKITAYPNPTSGMMNFTIGNNVKADVVVYNVYGQAVLNTTLTADNTSIDLSSFDAGMYYVAVTGADSVKIIKAIKR